MKYLQLTVNLALVSAVPHSLLSLQVYCPESSEVTSFITSFTPSSDSILVNSVLVSLSSTSSKYLKEEHIKHIPEIKLYYSILILSIPFNCWFGECFQFDIKGYIFVKLGNSHIMKTLCNDRCFFDLHPDFVIYSTVYICSSTFVI